jgi:hypothetical protein
MEVYASSADPDFVGLAIQYMFDVLPFSASAEHSQQIEAHLLAQLDRQIDAFAVVMSDVNVNAIIGCPEEKFRRSENNVVFEYLRRTTDEMVVREMVEVISDCENYRNSHNFFDTWVRLFQQVLACKQFAIEAKFPGKVQIFVAKRWKAAFGNGKGDVSGIDLGCVEADQFESAVEKFQEGVSKRQFVAPNFGRKRMSP